jgi:hypothetical protein
VGNEISNKRKSLGIGDFNGLKISIFDFAFPLIGISDFNGLKISIFDFAFPLISWLVKIK